MLFGAKGFNLLDDEARIVTRFFQFDRRNFQIPFIPEYFRIIEALFVPGESVSRKSRVTVVMHVNVASSPQNFSAKPGTKAKIVIFIPAGVKTLIESSDGFNQFL